MEGASRFLNRVWRFVLAHLDELRGRRRRSAPARSPTPGRAFRRTIHETIERVTDDIERDFHFNTAISAVMELVNALHDFERGVARRRWRAASARALLREAVETVLLLLGPVCPHVTEELWAALGHRESLFRRAWPTADAAALQRDEVQIVVQVDGKVRSRLTVDVGRPGGARSASWPSPTTRCGRGSTAARSAKVVVVPGRLVNIVTRPDEARRARLAAARPGRRLVAGCGYSVGLGGTCPPTSRRWRCPSS